MKRFILNKWEREVFENADKFTAVVFKGRGQYERHEFATEAEALKFATYNPRNREWVFYAIAGLHDVCFASQG